MVLSKALDWWVWDKINGDAQLQDADERHTRKVPIIRSNKALASNKVVIS